MEDHERPSFLTVPEKRPNAAFQQINLIPHCAEGPFTIRSLGESREASRSGRKFYLALNILSK